MSRFAPSSDGSGLTRRRALACLAGTALLGLPKARAKVDASAYPARPIKILIGFPPGGSTDGPVRVLVETVSKILKQPLIVENRIGDGGTLPAVALQATAADGYTLDVSSLGISRLPYTAGVKWNPSGIPVSLSLSMGVGECWKAFRGAGPARSRQPSHVVESRC